MHFLGEYRDEIENGTVKFPWEISTDENMKWLLAETTVEDIKLVCCKIVPLSSVEKEIAEDKQYYDEYNILYSDDFTLNSEGLWKIPDAVLKYLKTNEIIFCGVNDSVEVISSEDMERNMNLLKELEIAVREAAIEEGLYYEREQQS